MSSVVSNPTNEKPKKKSIFKKWWFWVLSIFTFIVLVGILSSGGSTEYELSQMQTMNKQQIIEKFGKPDEIIREDKEGFSYGYNEGFVVSGTDKGATEVILTKDMVKEETSDSYKIFDLTLSSSFDENVKRLGKPDVSFEKDGKNSAIYLTKEDFLLSFITEYNSDNIAEIQYAAYDKSLHITALDVSNLLNYKATKEDIQKLFEIKNMSSSQLGVFYDVEGLQIDTDNQNIIRNVVLLDRVHNIYGVRLDDSLDKANKVFGKPIASQEGVKNTTQYVYKYSDVGAAKRIQLSVDNANKKIVYMEVVLN